MDYNDYNIIKIIPGLYVSDYNIRYHETILYNLNIKYIININNTITNTNCITLNINIDKNSSYIDTSKLLNIDFNITNEFIINALQNNSNVLICDVNYSIPFLITGSFMLTYLDNQYTDTIYWLSKKISITNIPKNIIYQLFLYFLEIKLIS